MSHTPGPWKFLPGQDNQALHQDDPVAGTIYSTGTELHIARIWSDVDEGDAEANARLIAAAPDLLAALEKIASPEHCGTYAEIARAALAKVRT